ncbi:MAG: nucleotidyltransferase [Novosphingobium pentaromativorans]|uniref:Nucleotidyltransferase n=1 Tax=Novosphingobium pentaromativorans TaxID=205844 RepID=A0A2W5NDC7_9SPHN|nr:MAG: nucleotidyltransferase [Novosphingobium pentaromativorans]
MRRVVSLYLPTWPTDRIRRRAGRLPEGKAAPLVTALPDHGRRIIAAVDGAARLLGVTPGMTVTRARAMVPDLEVVDAAPEEDFEGLRRLALWAGRRYSPVVAPDPPDGIWIDITGCAHRFDGEMPMLKDMMRRVAAAGMACQAAVADTAGCAHAVARMVPSGRPSLIEPGAVRAALSILPVASLRVEPGVAQELRRMGFERIEQLIAAPRAPLAKRFGRLLYKRLDQALGQVPEPIEPIFPAEIPRARRGLLEPIGTAPAFTQVIGDLAGDITILLTRAGTGARALDLHFQRVDGLVQAIRVGTATPTRDAAHMTKLLAQKLGGIDPGLGIEAMTLIASLVQPMAASQMGSILAGERRGPDLAAIVDTLANRFGGRRLFRVQPRESTMPEREVEDVPALFRRAGTGWQDDLPRPSRMIVPPESIEVMAMLPDHPPAMFIWRGRRHRVAQADGPERLHGEWWRESGHEADTPYTVRDYFQVETAAGGRYWIFRLGDGESADTGPMRWFIHGAFA